MQGTLVLKENLIIIWKKECLGIRRINNILPWPAFMSYTMTFSDQ